MNKLEKSEKMVEELTKRRKMTKIVQDMLHKNIFVNCLVAICVLLYISIINIIYIHTSQNTSKLILKILAMISIFFTIAIFEISYRKDSGKLAIFGIESLVLSIVVLYIPKIYENLERKFYRELLIMPLFFAIYYIAKSIIIHFKTDKEYKDNLSDVKEIVKDE